MVKYNDAYEKQARCYFDIIKDLEDKITPLSLSIISFGCNDNKGINIALSPQSNPISQDTMDNIHLELIKVLEPFAFVKWLFHTYNQFVLETDIPYEFLKYFYIG